MNDVRANNLLRSLNLTTYAFEQVSCGSWWNYSSVNSPFTRMYLVTAGEAYVTFNDQELHLRPGTLTVVPPFVSAKYHCPESFDQYYAMFTAHVFDGLDLFSVIDCDYLVEVGPEAETLFQTLIQLAPDRGLKIYDHEDPEYRASIRRLAEGRTPAALSLQINGILRTLLGWILAAENESGLVAGDRSRLFPTLSYIDQNLHQPLALRDLAKSASLSPTYFSNLFTNTFGIRPSTYVAEKRLERAQFLLVTSTRSIKEIAALVGFSDADYFCRVFKARRVQSPGSFRATGGESR